MELKLIFTVTKVKHNWNPKFTREQLLPILYQQTVQVGLLLQQLDDAYKLLGQANVKITELEEVHKVGVYTEEDNDREDEENASEEEEEEVEREEEDNDTKVQNDLAVPAIDIVTHSGYIWIR